MSTHKHCDWELCKKDMGFHARITVNEYSHFCSWGCLMCFAEKQHIVLEVKDRGRKDEFWNKIKAAKESNDRQG